MRRPLLLGHRGAKAVAPENTTASLRRAIRDGADGLEFDVRATRDDACVLLHDEKLDRTTNGKGLLSQTSLEEVRRLDAAAWFSLDHQPERVPLLDDVLDEFLGKTALALEMKEVLPETALQDLAGRLRGAGDAFFVIASFQVPPLERARDIVPAAPRARILKRDQPLPPDDERQKLGLWGVFAREEDVDERYLADCRRQGLRCFVYTVNDPDRATSLARIGIDGIISDDPGTIRNALDQEPTTPGAA